MPELPPVTMATRPSTRSIIAPLRVHVLGAGLMGSQIGCEYALGGHYVTFLVRRREEAERRVRGALTTVSELGLWTTAEVEAAAHRMSFSSGCGDCDLIVESVPEDFDLKVELLRAGAEASPQAIVATNTSSLSITQLGEALGAPDRTVGTHYWNPPLLMPLVEVVAGNGTSDETLRRVSQALTELRKHPVQVKDVPGFVWNRLQLALLREALWIVENDVAAPETVDDIVRRGLARRWRMTGPFETVGLGGVNTFQKVAENLFPELSDANDAAGLSAFVDPGNPELSAVRERRDAELADEIRRDRSENS